MDTNPSEGENELKVNGSDSSIQNMENAIISVTSFVNDPIPTDPDESYRSIVKSEIPEGSAPLSSESGQGPESINNQNINNVDETQTHHEASQDKLYNSDTSESSNSNSNNNNSNNNKNNNDDNGGGGGTGPHRHSSENRRSKPYSSGFKGMCLNCKEYGHRASLCPRDKICNNCGETGHLVSVCTRPSICHNCKSQGHMAKDCTASIMCRSCGNPGHMSFNCPTRPDIDSGSGGNSNSASNFPGRCLNCGVYGHRANECKLDIICKICRRAGHMANSCPSSYQNRNNHDNYNNNNNNNNYNSQNHNSFKCLNCNQEGHRASNCPYEKLCNNCHQPGHFSRDCKFDHDRYRQFHSSSHHNSHNSYRSGNGNSSRRY